jgi:hypothetical protein
MRTRENISLMPKGKARVPKVGTSNLCKEGHDLNEFGTWKNNPKTGGLQRRCRKCVSIKQKARKEAKK